MPSPGLHTIKKEEFQWKRKYSPGLVLINTWETGPWLFLCVCNYHHVTPKNHPFYWITQITVIYPSAG